MKKDAKEDRLLGNLLATGIVAVLCLSTLTALKSVEQEPAKLPAKQEQVSQPKPVVPAVAPQQKIGPVAAVDEQPAKIAEVEKPTANVKEVPSATAVPADTLAPAPDPVASAPSVTPPASGAGVLPPSPSSDVLAPMPDVAPMVAGITEELMSSLKATLAGIDTVDWEAEHGKAFSENMRQMEKEMAQMHEQLASEMERQAKEMARMHEQIARQQADMARQQELMAKERAEMQRNQLELQERTMREQKAEMQKMEEEMRKREAEMKRDADRMKAFHKDLKRELIKDGIISSEDENMAFQFTDGGLYINGKKQSDKIYKKYKKLLDEQKKK